MTIHVFDTTGMPPLAVKMMLLAARGHPMSDTLRTAARHFTNTWQARRGWGLFWMDAHRTYHRALTIWPPQDPFDPPTAA